MTADLFGDKPRRPRRWLMHVVDAGDSNCCGDGPAGQPVAVRYACTRCGLETDWQTAENISAAKRGVSCPNCNTEETNPWPPHALLPTPCARWATANAWTS